MHYHWLSVLAVLAAVPTGGFASPLSTLWDDKRVKHTWGATPANWVSLGRPPAGTTIDLHIALKPYHEDALADALYEVSTPGRPKYGAHLSKEQVADLVAPHPDMLKLVVSWLEHHGISTSSVSRTHGGSWLTVSKVPVAQANGLLGASYQLYKHTGTNETVVILRTVGYSLPTALHAHVQTVAPTTYFESPRLLQQGPRKGSRGEGVAAMENATSSGELATVLRRDNSGDLVKPEILRSLYKTSAYVPAMAGQNKLGIVGFKNMYPSPTDLTAFMSAFRVDAVAATFTVDRVNNGGNNPNQPGTEANGNIQYSTSIAYPTPLTFYSIGGIPMWLGEEDDNKPEAGDAWLEWFNYILKLPKIPQTINISYGSSELTIPQGYAAGLCELFLQLSARGVSVLVASGDHGVGAGDCIYEDGKVYFNIQFPASCPWVTSVGGTTRVDTEIAAEISQGGFSYFFERPGYQDAAVTPFLENLGDKYSGVVQGRAVPDIAAQAIKLLIVNDGGYFAVDGTSYAAPTVTGIISLLNDYRMSQGIKPLGFLNPWLYDQGRAGLNDITSGANPGCNTAGFSAIVGWDPVTGLGTPNFQILQTVLPTSPPSGTLSSPLPSST